MRNTEVDFTHHPNVEFTEIRSDVRSQYLKEVENIVRSLPFLKSSNPGALDPIHFSFAISTVETLARQKSMEEFQQPYVTVNETFFKSAVRLFSEIALSQRIYSNLFKLWMKSVQEIAVTLFRQNGGVKRVFRKYITGELCEKSYLDKKHAQIVIDYFLTNNFLSASGRKFGDDLLVLNSHSD